LEGESFLLGGNVMKDLSMIVAVIVAVAIGVVSLFGERAFGLSAPMVGAVVLGLMAGAGVFGLVANFFGS
jgi:hypothetical protein